MSRVPARVLGILAVSALVALAWAGPAAAHSSEIESSPRAGSVLDESPAEVRIRFDSPLLDVGAAVVVRSADGVVVSSGAPRIGRNSIAVDVRADAAPGRYVVAYRVVSADGHTVTSTFDYTVRGDATAGESPTLAPASGAPTATASPIPVPAATHSSPAPSAGVGTEASAGMSALLIGALGLAAAAAVAALAVVARTRHRG